MRSKASLALAELLIMLLVFALAAALCLQAFAEADRISRETQLRTQAAWLARNAAETLKACGGDRKETAAALGGTGREEALLYDADSRITPDGEKAVLALRILPLPPAQPGLEQAEISVWRKGEDRQALFSLRVAWGVM